MRRKNKKRSNKKITTENNLYVKEINYDKLIDIFVQAYDVLEKKKNKIKEEQHREQQAEWDRILKQKAYPENERRLQRKLHRFRNEWMAYKELILFKEKNTKEAIATFALIKLATEVMFACLKWCLYILVFICIYNLFTGSMDKSLLFAFAFIAWTIARMIRIAVFEIKKMEDVNLILAVFSGSISFVALIVAIVTLVVSN